MENNFGMPSVVAKETAQDEKNKFTPEEEAKKAEFISETNDLINKIANNDFNKKSKEQQLKIYTKVKTIFGILALAGVALAAKSFGHLDGVRDMPETVLASKEAILEGLGVAMVVISALGACLTHAIYKNEKNNI